jgi:sensor histidine kinase YesM
MKFRLILFLIIGLWPQMLAAGDTLMLGGLTAPMLLSELGTVKVTNQPGAQLPMLLGGSSELIMDTASNHTNGQVRWLNLVLHNDSGRDAAFDLDFPAADSIVVYAKNNHALKRYDTGPYSDVRNWLYPENPSLVPLFFKSEESMELYIRLWSDKGRPFNPANAYIQPREQTLQKSVEGFRSFIGRVEFNGFFLGAVTFAMLFFLFIFLKVREPVFLFYGFYLLGAGLYAIVVKTLPYSFLARIAYLNYPLTYKLGEPVQYFFFAAYIAFAKSLLDIDARYLWLNHTVKIFTWILLLAGTSLLAYNLLDFQYELQLSAFLMSRIVILPTALILLVWITLVVHSRVKWFFVAGSSFFFLGGLLAVIVDPKSRHLFFGEIDVSSVTLFKSGILLESLCFALALGYKLRSAQIDKDNASKAYIEQLELNKRMARTETERLEKMVAERTEAVIEKNRQIEEQKQSQQQSTFKRQLAEMEMSALRSQMNPHFIFNSLNSIRYQILKNDYDNAATYLTRFSKLLRYILQNSREHTVSLAEEIEVNQLYLQLESLRFDQGLEFELSVQEGIDITEIIIPPMLLQPYVENAVKHGLVPSKNEKKKLIITILASDNGYVFSIEDNGIGRKAAGKRILLEDQKSLGMKIAEERIELFNLNFHPVITVGIEDLYDGQTATGTRVTFTYTTQL